MERSGAAQGLAEVLGVLGPEYLAGLLPDILESCGSRSAVAREGSLTLFKFLPLAVPDDCQVRRRARRQSVAGSAFAVPLEWERLLHYTLCSTRLVHCQMLSLTEVLSMDGAASGCNPRLQVHLEAILPAVLGGLADEAEGVRSAALAAGRTLVRILRGNWPCVQRAHHQRRCHMSLVFSGYKQ